MTIGRLGDKSHVIAAATHPIRISAIGIAILEMMTSDRSRS